MPPRTAPLLVGQRAVRPYRNRFTKFFFTELDKGLSSPYILLSSGVLFSYLAWRVTEAYIAPRRELLARRPLMQKVPLSESHNAFWGFKGVERDGVEALPGEGLAAGPAVGTGYSVQEDDAAKESAMRRPQVIHSEPSELHERPSHDNPTGEVDIVCLELPEYDPKLQDDVYYRSVHYIPRSIAGSSGGGAGGDRAFASSSSSEGRPTEAGQPPSSSSSSSSSSDATAAPESYLSFMPGKGQDVIHGMAKCKATTVLNNCVPYAGHLESEVGRKLMLCLAPVHVLLDAGKVFLKLRFTFVKQVPVETLIIGLHGGELPRWLSRSFPNFNVTVVEPDGALVGVARRFLGFQESSNLHLHVGSPLDFLRTVAAAATVGHRASSSNRRYDLVVIDAVDGSGHLSTQYSRMESLTNLRNAMSDNGCVAVALPNQEAALLYNVVQNWRMAFSGRTVLLVHCCTSPTTVLMTFQDNAGRGKSNMGSVVSVDEFQDLLRAHLKHYGPGRVQFDLTTEVNKSNFTILEPGRSYEMADYLPKGHPELKRLAGVKNGGRETKNQGWNAWVRRKMGDYLSSTQRADLGYSAGSWKA